MADIEDIYRLSPLQAGMLFQALYEGGGQAYISQARFTLSGELSPAVLRAAFDAAVLRHPVMRSAIVWKELPEPVQTVLRTCTMPWQEHDWRDGDPRDAEARLEAFCLADRKHGFVLERPPLMRAHLIRLAEERFAFIWTWHHILLDGWSVAQLLPELIGSYQAVANGGAAVPIARRPYRDYIAWLRQQQLASAKAYWTRRLAGFTTPTPCPIAQADGEDALFRQIELDATETARLVTAARSRHLTPSTVAQACWAFLLSRMTGRDDVTFGGVVSGRPPSLADAERMLGLFINTLPVRVRVPSSGRVDEWLDELQQEQVRACEFEYTPLAEIRRWTSMVSGGLLFDSIVVFENFPAPRHDIRHGGETRLRIEAHEGVSYTGFPLTVSIGLDERLRIRLSVRNAGARTEEELLRLGGQLLALFRAVLVRRTDTIDDLHAAWDRAAAMEADQERARRAAARRRIIHRYGS